MSIEILGVTKLYGEQKALDSVSFEVKTGEIVGLLGPNGAGKSTLMKIITCFLPPTEGSVNVCGHSIINDSLAVRSKIGYLAETNPLYGDMYITEFLSFIADIYKVKNKKQRIEEMISITGLQPERKKRIRQLSKGFRQRVGLAQALIHNPEVLILDEPTSGLDPNQIIEIRSLICEIGRFKTVLLSTHIMQEVEAICSRAIIINKGKIVADDTIENLQKLNSNNNLIVEFDREIDIMLFSNIKTIKSVSKRGSNSWFIQPVENVDIRKDIFQFAVDNNLTILSIEKEKSSVEEVFRQLTTQ